MNNVFTDPSFVAKYEAWYEGRGQRADRLEKRLLARQLAGFAECKTIVEVGCGTGHFTRWMSEQGLEALGLDISLAMLHEAQNRNGAQYLLADAEVLPFNDRAFDLSALITTLEFVSNSQRVLSETMRVASHGLILGVLNRNSLLAIERRRSGKPPWNTARFFSPNELARLVINVAGRRLQSLTWRTTLWPRPVGGSLPLPWGGFIGMAAKLR